jgi:hypothetical protein
MASAPEPGRGLQHTARAGGVREAPRTDSHLLLLRGKLVSIFRLTAQDLVLQLLQDLPGYVPDPGQVDQRGFF